MPPRRVRFDVPLHPPENRDDVSTPLQRTVSRTRFTARDSPRGRGRVARASANGSTVNADRSNGVRKRSRAPQDDVPDGLRRQLRYGLRGRVFVARTALRRFALAWLDGLGQAYYGSLCTVSSDEFAGVAPAADVINRSTS